MTEPAKTTAVDDARVMRIWRECGLPEYFLGNGGTNEKLVKFADAIDEDDNTSVRQVAREIRLQDEARISELEAQLRQRGAEGTNWFPGSFVIQLQQQIAQLQSQLKETNERSDHYCKLALVPDGTESRKEISQLQAQLRQEREAHESLRQQTRQIDDEFEVCRGQVAELQAALNEQFHSALTLAGTVVKMDAEKAQLQTTISQLENREHVAWIRYKKRGGSDESYIVLCDSDAPGAFKVYR